MSKSTFYNFGDFGSLGDSTFPTSAPTGMLAGFNPNYSGLMPGGGFSSGFGSGFDLNQINKIKDPIAQIYAMQIAENRYQGDPKRLAEAYKELAPFRLQEAKEMQKLGKESVLFSAAVNSVANLPKIIAQGVGQVRDARLAGQQAILNQAQRPYNIGGFSMPYNAYRI